MKYSSGTVKQTVARVQGVREKSEQGHLKFTKIRFRHCFKSAHSQGNV